jgi:hypothetical protein
MPQGTIRKLISDKDLIHRRNETTCSSSPAVEVAFESGGEGQKGVHRRASPGIASSPSPLRHRLANFGNDRRPGETTSRAFLGLPVCLAGPISAPAEPRRANFLTWAPVR